MLNMRLLLGILRRGTFGKGRLQRHGRRQCVCRLSSIGHCLRCRWHSCRIAAARLQPICILSWLCGGWRATLRRLLRLHHTSILRSVCRRCCRDCLLWLR